MSEPIPTQATEPAPRSGARHTAARVLQAPVVGAFAAGALIVLAVTALLHVSVPGTSWQLDILASLRWVLFTHAITQAALLAVLVGLLAALQLVVRPAVRAVATAALALLVLVWLSSWGLFWATGRFLDQDSFELAAAAPMSMLWHVTELAPATIVLIPLGTAAVVLTVVVAARMMTRTLPGGRIVLLLLAVGIVLGADSFRSQADRYLSGSDLLMPHPDGANGMPLQVQEVYAELRNERTEPFAHLRSSRARQLIESVMAPGIDVVWPSIDEYETPPPAQPYNVVLLVVESLRADELAVHGSNLAVMPNVDRMAAEATVYLDHYASATHSNYAAVVPVSSQYPLRDERMHVYPADPLYPRVLLYDVLEPLGYRTAIVSSQNEGWGGMINFLSSDQLDHLFHAAGYEGEKIVPEAGVADNIYVRQYGLTGKIDDRFTINEAIRWIGADTTAAPFMMYINLQNSHTPYPIPKDAATPFGPRAPSFPIRFNYFPPDSVEVVRGVYRNALHYVDAQIGRLIEHLRQTGQWDNTIFVVVGDHGQAFFEHGFVSHSNELYEELLRTPLVIHAPGLTNGVRRGLVQHVDIAPTVLELLGLPPHPGFQGSSVVHRTREFAYLLVQSPLSNQFGIVSGTEKLVVDARRRTTVLRDLSADPAERYDFSDRDPLRTEALRHRLDTWRAAQLRYYNTPLLQGSMYAPVLPEARVLQRQANR